MEDTGLMIQRVSALLQRPSDDPEATLMDGYARALALEAERVRLERRFEELTGRLDSDRLDELDLLKSRISRTNEELSRLRSVLTLVRRHLAAAALL